MFEHVIWTLNRAKGGSMGHQNRQHGVIITAACVPKAKLEFANIRNYMHIDKWLKTCDICYFTFYKKITFSIFQTYITKQHFWTSHYAVLLSLMLGSLCGHHTGITAGMKRGKYKCNFLAVWCSYQDFFFFKSVRWFFNSWRDNIQVTWAESIRPICCYKDL